MIRTNFGKWHHGIRRVAGWLALMAGLAITIGSLLPAADVPSNLPSDKLLHVVGYLSIASLTAIAVGPGRRLLYWGLAILAMGGTIELLQALSPGRETSALDMLANGIGVVLGSTLGALVHTYIGLSD